MLAIGRLEGGIQGIHDRLDKINGCVERHEQDVALLKEWRAGFKGSVAVIAVIASSIAGFVIYIGKIFIEKIIDKTW
jgi:hypothetical protein